MRPSCRSPVHAPEPLAERLADDPARRHAPHLVGEVGHRDRELAPALALGATRRHDRVGHEERRDRVERT